MRVLGAPRLAIFGIVWIKLLLLIGAGILPGLGQGYLGARMASAVLTRQSGVVLPVTIEGSDLCLVALLMGVAALAALIPATLAYRQSPATALRG